MPRTTSSETRARIGQLLGMATIGQFVDLARQRLRPSPRVQALIENGANIIDAWSHERGVSHVRALVDACHACDLVSGPEREHLLYELEEDPNVIARPSFDRKKGNLRFNGRTVRTVRLHKEPTVPFRILDAFEDAGWPDSIEWEERATIDTAVYGLNDNLQDLRFYVRDRRIYWQVVSMATSASLDR